MAITSTEIETAIRAILTTGQSYKLSNNREVTHANLGELRALRSEMLAEEAQASNGGIFVPVTFGSVEGSTAYGGGSGGGCST